MSTRTAVRLAWSLWVLTVALMVLTSVFRLLRPLSEDPTRGAADLIISMLFVATFPTVGALIACRRPEHPIGWVFCAMSLLTTIAVLLGHYAEYSLVVEPVAFPLANTAAWVENWIWPVAISPVGFFLLLFPEGRPPSRRWWPVAWLLAAALVGWFLSQAFVPGSLTNAGYESVRNPYGIEALGRVSSLLLLGSVLAAATSLIVRFRRSRGGERRQLEWVTYAGALVILVLILQLGVESIVPQNEPLEYVFNLILTVALCCVPVSAGIAILRYRLYDIDLIINRTLVYGALTAMLALVYVGSVVGLQTAFRAISGQESTLAVVASTLTIAALSGPLRRRVQALVDRRFYRRKYDAAKTLETFSAKLKDETDLGHLGEEMVGVVRETMQPAHVGLWLRNETVPDEGTQAD